MNELNKKLAEWAGFMLEGRIDTWGFCWEYPDGKCRIRLPNFTESLDACFKWLVPKAIDQICSIFKVDSESAYQTLFNWWLREAEASVVNASALCKAIEKLMEGGNNG